MPMVITDGLSAAGMVVRDGQSDFRSTHPSVEPHRGGCRPRSAGCQRANPTGGKSTTSQSTGTLDATGCRPHVLTAIQQVRTLARVSWLACGGGVKYQVSSLSGWGRCMTHSAFGGVGVQAEQVVQALLDRVHLGQH